MRGLHSSEHGEYYVRLVTFYERFSLLLLCAFVLVYSCLFTWILYMAAQGLRPELAFLGFVISLMLATLMAPVLAPKSNMLMFCMQLCCLAHTWVSSSVVVSLLLT